MLSLRCTANRQKLQGIILKAVNLPRPHKWGMAGIYYVLYICVLSISCVVRCLEVKIHNVI